MNNYAVQLILMINVQESNI